MDWVFQDPGVEMWRIFETDNLFRFKTLPVMYPVLQTGNFH